MVVLDSPKAAPAPAGGVFMGLDWGNSHHQLCVLDSSGTVLDRGRFTHDTEGLARLDERLAQHGPVTGIAIERAEGLLVERLQDQGLRLFCVSPKMSARARERYRMARP